MLRTGEILGLRSAHAFLESQQPKVVVPLGLTKGGKRPGAAESIVLEYDLVVFFLKHWKQLASTTTPLASSAAHWRGLFTQALDALQLQKWNFRPYSKARRGHMVVLPPSIPR